MYAERRRDERKSVMRFLMVIRNDGSARPFPKGGIPSGRDSLTMTLCSVFFRMMPAASFEILWTVISVAKEDRKQSFGAR